ncbi:MAG: SRPBCC domain-containing protein [Chitinophagaceae bacterium]|nr:SRPBCC domain-containing protein [Chitinophagaceae bacterium]
MAATTKNVTVNKDVANKKITVVREFDAPVERVWKAWTEKESLDRWWAPRPWKAETKSMDFREGGSWLYAMVGPDGEKHWAAMNFKKIETNKGYTAEDYFADENGKRSGDLPGMNWKTTFAGSGDTTKVTIEITFSREEDLQKILEMGFEQGFLAALGNLDELL